MVSNYCIFCHKEITGTRIIKLITQFNDTQCDGLSDTELICCVCSISFIFCIYNNTNIFIDTPFHLTVTIF